MKLQELNIWPNVKWGWKWAFAVATAFSLWVLVVAEPERSGIAGWTLCAVYFSEAAIAGVILGLLRPWARSSRWGAAFTGFVIAIVLYLGVQIVHPLSWTVWAIGTAIVSVLGGAGLGVVIYDEEHRNVARDGRSRYQRLQDFLHRHEHKLAALLVLGLFLVIRCYATHGSP